MGAVAGQWEIWHTLSGLQLHWSKIISLCYAVTRKNYHKTLYKRSCKTWFKANLISPFLIEKQIILVFIHSQIIYLFNTDCQSVTLHVQFFLPWCSDFCAKVRASEISHSTYILAVTQSVYLWVRNPLFEIISGQVTTMFVFIFYLVGSK